MTAYTDLRKIQGEEPQRRRRSDYEPQVLSKSEMKDIFMEVGKTLIKDTFEVVGVDISDEDSRAEVRKDFTWLRNVRNASSELSQTARKVGFGAIASALVVSLWYGFKTKYLGGG